MLRVDYVTKLRRLNHFYTASCLYDSVCFIQLLWVFMHCVLKAAYTGRSQIDAPFLENANILHVCMWKLELSSEYRILLRVEVQAIPVPSRRWFLKACKLFGQY